MNEMVMGQSREFWTTMKELMWRYVENSVTMKLYAEHCVATELLLSRKLGISAVDLSRMDCVSFLC